jgi:hypothetical protein
MKGRRAIKRKAGIATDLMLAPLVIGMRVPLLVAEAGAYAAGPGSETARAVSEKAAALAEGMAAAQMEIASAALRFWPELLSGRTPSLMSGMAADRAIQAAMKPAGRKVKANYRRLSSRKG